MKNSGQPVALITGGSRGIGLATVKKFKENGWIVATCSSQEHNLRNNPADLKFQCNVTQVGEVKAGIQKVVNQFGKIDLLVNNAGLAGNNPMDPESSDDLWEQIIQVNLNGTYYMSKYAAPYIPDKTGRIVNIASVLALKGVPDATAYCAAKHGVLGFTRSLAHFLSKRKITVNAVCPGWTRTDMAEGRMKQIGLKEKDFETAVPLGRFIEPEEIADFIFFLATSPGGAMITGQALTVDGGVLA